MRKSMTLGIVAAAGLVIWTGALTGDEKGKAHGTDNHVMVRADDVKWGPSPPSLPEGAKVAVLMGDPSKAVPYVLRVKMPDGYKVPPHWHPTAENVTVLQGTLMVGKGEKFDVDASEALNAGGFMSMPKDMRHFAWAKGETVIQIHGIGPFDITYVNADDDPRKK
jgi:quercetin dioxygenase-like cupin family protein